MGQKNLLGEVWMWHKICLGRCGCGTSYKLVSQGQPLSRERGWPCEANTSIARISTVYVCAELYFWRLYMPK